MYIDDGASRESAPSHRVPQGDTGFGRLNDLHHITDSMAADKYCQVSIEQAWYRHISEKSLQLTSALEYHESCGSRRSYPCYPRCDNQSPVERLR
jgi:hypothetical protein